MGRVSLACEKEKRPKQTGQSSRNGIRQLSKALRLLTPLIVEI